MSKVAGGEIGGEEGSHRGPSRSLFPQAVLKSQVNIADAPEIGGALTLRPRVVDAAGPVVAVGNDHEDLQVVPQAIGKLVVHGERLEIAPRRHPPPVGTESVGDEAQAEGGLDGKLPLLQGDGGIGNYGAEGGGALLTRRFRLESLPPALYRRTLLGRGLFLLLRR